MPALVDLVWGTGLRKSVTATAGMVSAIAVAVVAVPPAWSALGLPEVATRVFVHAQVDPVKLAQADTTRAVYQLQLQNLESSLYAAQKDQEAAPSDTVRQRIDDLSRQIQQVQSKLNAGR